MSFPATQFLGGFRRLDWLILLLGGSGIQRSWLGDRGSRSRGWGLGGCGTCTFLESVWVRLAHGDDRLFFLSFRSIEMSGCSWAIMHLCCHFAALLSSSLCVVLFGDPVLCVPDGLNSLIRD